MNLRTFEKQWMNHFASGISKADINLSKAKISSIISEELDNFNEIVLDIPDPVFINGMAPNRITFNVNNYETVIKLSNIYNTIGMNNKTKQPECIHAMCRVSASDSDEMSRAFATGIAIGGGMYVN